MNWKALRRAAEALGKMIGQLGQVAADRLTEITRPELLAHTHPMPGIDADGEWRSSGRSGIGFHRTNRLHIHDISIGGTVLLPAMEGSPWEHRHVIHPSQAVSGISRYTREET